MATRTASEIYQTLLTAGWDAASATTMTAIALAESSGSDTVLGDQGLQNDVWGPSVGLFQIRTLKGQTGSGSARDITALMGNPAAQAAAAYQISAGGRNFTPWSVYTSGRYQDFLGQARAAAGGAVSAGTGWLPWNWSSGDIVSEALGGVRTIGLEAVFLGLGIGLVWVGALRLVAPAARKITKGAVGL